MGTDDSSLEDWLNNRPVAAHAAHGRYPLGHVLGEWRLEAYLGHGCSSEVYRVINVRTGREGALKLLVSLDPEIRDRFVVEKDTIRFLQFGAFPTYYDSGKVDGNDFYVMEYLQPFLFPLPRHDIARFMVALAKAVQRLHTAGYVHRDLKPANILRRSNGQPVLIDPGLVKKMDAPGGETRPSPRSLVNGRPCGVGTLDFSAPEQMLKGVSSARSDVFSLGKVLQACFEKKPRGPWLAIIRRATQEQPDDRYASADDFARAIRHRHWPAVQRALFGLALILLAVGVARVGAVPRTPPQTVPAIDAPANPETLLKQQGETETDQLRRLLPLAETGNLAAQLLVAEAYFYGRGTSTNLFEAVHWYRRAADKGNADAQASLGLCYLYGYGCEKDPVRAFGCFRDAAQDGNAVAMTNLAFCYLNGFGEQKNATKGFDWARAAAERGSVPGQVLLAECYLSGRGCAPDRAAAERWLRKAAQKGNKRAKMLLGTLADVNPEPTAAAKPPPPAGPGRSL